MKSRFQLAKEIAAAKVNDPLAGLDPKEIAAFYGRVADFVEKKVGAGNSLAAQFLRHWLNGKGAPLQVPPGKLATNTHIANYLRQEVRHPQRPVDAVEGEDAVPAGKRLAVTAMRISRKPIYDLHHSNHAHAPRLDQSQSPESRAPRSRADDTCTLDPKATVASSPAI